MNVSVRSLIANMRFASANWIGLALAAGAGLSLASPSDLAPEHAGGRAMDSVASHADVSATQVAPYVESQSCPDFSGHWALYQRLQDRRAPESQSRQDISGLWSLNAKTRDDPQEKAKAARKAMKQPKDGGRPI